MKAHYHRQVTRQALADSFSRRALQVILEASLRQDDLAGQLFHPEYHFDENLQDGWSYLDGQHEQARAALDRGDEHSAWQAFGRLIHAAQDFYSHSTYVAVWASRHSAEERTVHSQDRDLPPGLPPPDSIRPMDPQVLEDPDLRTDHIYFPWDGISALPLVGRLLRRFMPEDSHTRMNLDSPDSGLLFAYALQAAAGRTRYEFERFCDGLEPETLRRFTGCPVEGCGEPAELKQV